MLHCIECNGLLVERTFDQGELTHESARVLLRGITIYECVRCRDRYWPPSAMQELDRRAAEEKTIPGYSPPKKSFY